MTVIEEGLRAFLLADATFSGLVGGVRVHSDVLPHPSEMPAVVLTIIGGASVVSHDGPSGLENPTIQVDCWANSPSDRRDLFEAVRKRINGYHGLVGGVNVQGIFLVRKRDLYDNDAKLYRRTADFSIWNEEST